MRPCPPYVRRRCRWLPPSRPVGRSGRCFSSFKTRLGRAPEFRFSLDSAKFYWSAFSRVRRSSGASFLPRSGVNFRPRRYRRTVMPSVRQRRFPAARPPPSPADVGGVAGATWGVPDRPTDTDQHGKSTADRTTEGWVSGPMVPHARSNDRSPITRIPSCHVGSVVRRGRARLACRINRCSSSPENVQ